MPRTRPPYSLEFRQQMVELVKAGRTPEELSREFEPTSQTIHNWVKQSDIDTGVRGDGLTSSELEELRSLRRENKRLLIGHYELEVLKGASASLSKVQAVIAEVCYFPFQSGMPVFHEVVGRLAEFGFVVADILSLQLRPLDGASHRVKTVRGHEGNRRRRPLLF